MLINTTTSSRVNTFRYLEHTSDIGIEVTASTIENLFQHAAEGLLSIFIDPKQIRSIETRAISLHAGDDESLLFRWLNEWLFLFDCDGFIPKKFRSLQYSRDESGVSINAFVLGDHFDERIHAVRTYVKAATYHKLSIEKTESGYIARVFFDV